MVEPMIFLALIVCLIFSDTITRSIKCWVALKVGYLESVGKQANPHFLIVEDSLEQLLHATF
jgi:hypothetical protein